MALGENTHPQMLTAARLSYTSHFGHIIMQIVSLGFHYIRSIKIKF